MNLFLGDVHGKWDKLNWIIEKYKPENILQCGDFGFWPAFKDVSLDRIKNGECKIYFCDGNHEDHWALRKLEDVEVGRDIFYVPRGGVKRFGNYNIMFMGGADSIDKGCRSIGVDWFPEEVIGMKDIEKALSYNGKVDIIVSHTLPSEIAEKVLGQKCDDCSCVGLDAVWEKFKPALWVAGHFHRSFKVRKKGCNFVVLNEVVEYGSCEDAIFIL